MPPATDQEIKKALADADILVHVDPFSLKERCIWRLSFSTKIVDYLSSSRAILAIGPQDVASMQYLIDNDVALCVTDIQKIDRVLNNISKDRSCLNKYAEKAFFFGKEKHLLENVSLQIENDFSSLM